MGKVISLKKHQLLVILNIVAKLIHVIRHCLNACTRRAVRESREDGAEQEKENVSVSGPRGSLQGAGPAARWGPGRALPLP